MKGILFSFFAGLFFATAYLFDKLALSKYDISPLWGIFIRTLTAVIIITAITMNKVNLQEITIEMRDSAWILICSGICFTAAIYCVFTSFSFLPAGQASTIHLTVATIAIMTLSVLFLNESLSLIKVIGVTFCIIGIILVTNN
jgi:uncharacterized membrane protein